MIRLAAKPLLANGLCSVASNYQPIEVPDRFAPLIAEAVKEKSE